MARISGVDIPNAKRVEVALTYIYGIGPKSAKDILAKTGINPDTRAKDLTEDDIAKLRDEIENNYGVDITVTIYDADGTAIPGASWNVPDGKTLSINANNIATPKGKMVITGEGVDETKELSFTKQ